MINLTLAGIFMTTERINELIELLQYHWEKEPSLHLGSFLQKLADEAGFTSHIKELPDDVLIYHLKLRNLDKTADIPGLQKDFEPDFKTALLRARGILKD